MPVARRNAVSAQGTRTESGGKGWSVSQVMCEQAEKVDAAVPGVKTRTLFFNARVGYLTITERQGRGKARETSYWLDGIGRFEDGVAFRLSKVIGEESYDVFLDTAMADPDRAAHSCECLGHLAHGGKTRCKHLAAMLALKAEGRI